jgi:hypothetical protein
MIDPITVLIVISIPVAVGAIRNSLLSRQIERNHQAQRQHIQTTSADARRRLQAISRECLDDMTRAVQRSRR